MIGRNEKTNFVRHRALVDVFCKQNVSRCLTAPGETLFSDLLSRVRWIGMPENAHQFSVLNFVFNYVLPV